MRVHITIRTNGTYLGERPDAAEVDFTLVSGPYEKSSNPGHFRDRVEKELIKALDYLGVENGKGKDLHREGPEAL